MDWNSNYTMCSVVVYYSIEGNRGELKLNVITGPRALTLISGYGLVAQEERNYLVGIINP